MRKIIVGLICLVSISLQATSLLKNILVFEDSSKYDTLGYGVCDPQENGEYNLLKNLLAPEMLVFDIGANIGCWSKQVLALQPTIHIHAFEPLPQTCEALKKNLRNMPVAVHNCALSDSVSEKDFYVYADARGATDWSSLYFRPVIADAKKDIIKVPTIDLDTFCKEHGINQIDFLKIDTEGAELFVFKGALEMLSKKALPIIQFEYGGCYIDSKTTLKEVYELLTSYGYTIYRIVPQGLIKINSWRSPLENFEFSNYVAILT